MVKVKKIRRGSAGGEVGAFIGTWEVRGEGGVERHWGKVISSFV